MILSTLLITQGGTAFQVIEVYFCEHVQYFAVFCCFLLCFATSMLQVHLSFSQGGSSGVSEQHSKDVPLPSTVFTVLLKSVGVTLTEIQDVVFKLASLNEDNVSGVCFLLLFGGSLRIPLRFLKKRLSSVKNYDE